MTREEQLIDKIKGLVRRARLPRFFNRYGRKWHPTRQLVLCHAVYALYARCWRRAAKFMREFYGITMTFSCWRKAILKIPSWAWDALARASAGDKPCALAAIDGTTLARSNPSQHYYQRILGGKTARPTQQLLMIDVQRRKFLAWRFRSHQRGETIDVPYLLRHTPRHAQHHPHGQRLRRGMAPRMARPTRSLEHRTTTERMPARTAPKNPQRLF